ncbi:ISPsy18 [Pseudomonas amygdali pv. sesami]|nr:ISPsy18 [Pseudomonas amygdali pv. sesami]
MRQFRYIDDSGYNDLKTRGVEDVLIAVTDGLKGIPEALGAVFPATTLQTCIVHLIRNSLRRCAQH